jgi:hypothetical protein
MLEMALDIGPGILVGFLRSEHSTTICGLDIPMYWSTIGELGYPNKIYIYITIEKERHLHLICCILVLHVYRSLSIVQVIYRSKGQKVNNIIICEGAALAKKYIYIYMDTMLLDNLDSLMA